METYTQGKKDSRGVRHLVIGAFLGFFLSLGGTHFWRVLDRQEQHAERCRRLREELRYNTVLLQVAELRGHNPTFHLEAWKEFSGSDSFYVLPDDVKRALTSFHLFLRLRNNGLLGPHKFSKLKESDLSSKDLAGLLAPFLEYLVRERIISPNDATLQWNLDPSEL